MTNQSMSEAGLDARVPERWRPVVRAIWLVTVFGLLLLFFAAIIPYFKTLSLPCDQADCPVLSISSQEAGILGSIGLSISFYGGYQTLAEIFRVLAFTIPAFLIFWQRSDTWMGILVSLALVFLTTVFLSGATLEYVTLHPALSALNDFLLTPVAVTLLMLLFFLFPDGHFVPRWTRLVAVVLAAATFLEPLLPLQSQATASGTVFLILVVITSLVLGIGAQIFRYRHVSTPAQRQQTKWILFGFAVTFVAMIVWVIFAELFPFQPGAARLAFYLSVGLQILAFTLLPVSMVFSILRYRLWDIDIVINRALVYGLLTAALALLYFASVLLIQALFRALTGQGSQVAIVLSTLAIAALFTPLRRRIQDFIDRRFYRRKYDAARTLAAFNATVRDEVDLEVLTAELLRVVEETMQPKALSLWLRER
jgi:hypothetical protein